MTKAEEKKLSRKLNVVVVLGREGHGNIYSVRALTL